MEENRFFKFIWRLNGVAIMLLLLFLMVVAGYHCVKEILPRRRPVAVINVAEDPKGEEKWTLGNPQDIDGTPFIYIPLVSEKKEINIAKPGMVNKALRSYDGGHSKNLLFLNKQTGEMKWLFKDNRQLVTNTNLLSLEKRYDKERKIEAILYHVIAKDTNGDKKLTSEDSADIGISYPDGSHYKELFQDVERIFGASVLGGREILVLYQSKGKGYASTILLQDMSIREKKEMPKITVGSQTTVPPAS
jgi:hypothetical protein